MRRARSGTRAILTALALTLLLAPPSLAAPESYGLPPRLRHLTDLTPILERKDLTAAEKTEVLVAWLIEERRHASPTTRGLGGGDIDSGYVQAQLVKAMSELGDPLSLRETTADPEADPAVRDAASLALGGMYDIAQVPRLLTILEASSEPDFRALAATSLGAMGAVEARPALERALLDEFTRRGAGRTKASRTAYPVREAAQVALRVLVTEDPEILRYRTERIEAFARRLQAAKAAADSTRKRARPAGRPAGYARPASETTALLRKGLETEPAPSAAERVEVCLSLLKQEMASPSAPEFGIGGGPIDSGYLQEVIMGSVCTFGQSQAEREEIRALIAAKLASTPASDQGARDRLVVILGYTGDPTVAPQLTVIAESDAEGFMRHSAILALGEMQDYRGAVPALRRAMESDTYARIRYSGRKEGYDSTTMVYSPVRAAAAELLKRVGSAVPERAEVLEARYGVQRLEPLLYEEGDLVRKGAVEALGAIGGVEAKAALQTFVDREAGVAGTEGFVEQAREALATAR